MMGKLSYSREHSKRRKISLQNWEEGGCEWQCNNFDPGYFLCFFRAALAGLDLDFDFALETAGRTDDFAGARFAGAGFPGIVFFP